MIDLKKFFNKQCYRPEKYFYENPHLFPIWKRFFRPVYRLAEDSIIRLAMAVKISPNWLWGRQLAGYTYLSGRLKDDEAKQLLEKVVAMRILSGRFVRFEENEVVFSRIEKELNVTQYYGCGTKMAVDMSAIFGLPDALTVDIEPYMVATLACGQYRHPSVHPDLGDVCVDFGAYLGETSLLFAELVGSAGHVYSVEFGTEQLKALKRNLEANFKISTRISVLDHPFWSESGKKVFLSGIGGLTRVSFERGLPDAEVFETMTLDDAVGALKIDRLDFIKMDVEGAEYPILQGAVNTLKRFKPKLAVSVYHSDEDFDRIPRFLDSLDCGYEFTLGHYSLVAAETVLYAHAK